MKDVALEPCPACQEPVHPVAGRCKHCRADLVTLRAQLLAAHKRAAAAARAAAATPLRVSRLEPAAPARVTSSPSSSSRKLVLAAAAVLLAGVAGGVVAQKLYAKSASAAGAPAARQALAPAASAPGAPPPWGNPFGAPDPDPAPNPPHDPSFPFADPFDFGGRGGGGGATDPFSFLRPRAPSPAPRGQRTDVSDVQDFLPAMVDAVCAKLAQCGVVDDAMAGICRMMSESLVDEETVERVRRGECRYDASSAGQCLEAVGGMTCDSAADPGQLLALADQLSSCSRTLECR